MDISGHTLAPSLDPQEVSNWRQRFPGLAEALSRASEVIQGPHEALFVPSGWHHSVENLEDTASINHNWLNGFNIGHAVRLLCGTFERGRQLIDDCRCAALYHLQSSVAHRTVACAFCSLSRSIPLRSGDITELSQGEHTTSQKLSSPTFAD